MDMLIYPSRNRSLSESSHDQREIVLERMEPGAGRDRLEDALRLRLAGLVRLHQQRHQVVDSPFATVRGLDLERAIAEEEERASRRDVDAQPGVPGSDKTLATLSVPEDRPRAADPRLAQQRRIARDVHDGVGILINSVKQNLQKASLNTEDRKLVSILEQENMKLLEDAMQRVRNIAKDLMPQTLGQLGFMRALREISKTINKTGKIELVVTEEASGIRLIESVELQLYRLSLELINNIIKHDNATRVTVEYFPQQKPGKLVITHTGKGINNEAIAKLLKRETGLGLKSIQSRAQLVNAKVNYYQATAVKMASIEIEIGN